MPYAKRNRRDPLASGAVLIFAGVLAAACAPIAEPSYMDATGNHESPHPHRPDAGKSVPERVEDVVRVRSDEERARMERYIAEFVDPADVVTSIKLSEHELIDCVAMDRQPALRRPGVSRSDLRSQPPTNPDEEAVEAIGTLVGDPAREDRVRMPELEYGANGQLCPEETVPVRRLTMEILDNFETLEDFFRARPPHALTGPTDEHQYANAWVTADNWGRSRR